MSAYQCNRIKDIYSNMKKKINACINAKKCSSIKIGRLLVQPDSEHGSDVTRLMINLYKGLEPSTTDLSLDFT